MPREDNPTLAIIDAAQQHFGERGVECAYCVHTASSEDEHAEWEAARRVGELGGLLRDSAPERPLCPGCTVLMLAEMAATGQVAITPTKTDRPATTTGTTAPRPT